MTRYAGNKQQKMDMDTYWCCYSFGFPLFGAIMVYKEEKTLRESNKTETKKTKNKTAQRNRTSSKTDGAVLLFKKTESFGLVFGFI